MGAAATSLSFKSQRTRKRFPAPGEMVRVEDRKGLFVVMRIDRERGEADLMQRVGKSEVVDSHVALQRIHKVPPAASMAIQEFLNTGGPQTFSEGAKACATRE